MNFIELIKKAETVQECLNIYAKTMEVIELYSAGTSTPVVRKKVRFCWDCALEALKKALKIARKKEEVESVLQKAALHKDRGNFKKLWEDAKNKIASLKF